MQNVKDNKIVIIFTSVIYILIIIGLIFIYSSSSVFALEKLGSANFFVKKQLAGIILGSIGLFALRFIPIKFIYKLTPVIFICSIILTLLSMTKFFGQTIHGSSRWINIGGIGFQPSELLKISFILYAAYFIEKKGNKIRTLSKGYVPFLVVLGLISLILLKQPDFGQTITITSTGIILLFLAGCKIKHILFTLLATTPILITLITLKAYRLKRILTFMNPWNDPQGSGFQIIQSLIAVGSGNFWGVGIANSKQKFFYLPMQHTDFVFSIIAEETGFLGCLLLVLLYMILIYSGFALASKTENLFCRFTILGFTILTGLQSMINIFVATGLAPTKGIGLPFVSYGMSSITCNLLMVGIIINCFLNEKEIEEAKLTSSNSLSNQRATLHQTL